MKSNQLMELFGVSDIMDLPDAIMEVLLGDIDRRNDVYTRLLEMNGMDVSYDWFQEMYESELAERSQKAQLFTPPELSKLLAGLTGAPHGGQTIHEPTAGEWWADNSQMVAELQECPRVGLFSQCFSGRVLGTFATFNSYSFTELVNTWHRRNGRTWGRANAAGFSEISSGEQN